MPPPIHWTNESGDAFNRTCYSHATSNHYDLTTLIVTVLLTNLDILVVAGNLLVLLAFVVDRHLRTPTHYFIGSLAAADLALGIFVLPFAIAFETTGAWTFGVPLCQLWLAVDVWLCTASIYGLIMVGIDRFVAVTRPLAYKSFMTHKRASLMIATAWSISLVICLPTFVVSSYRASKAVQSTCQCTQMIHGPIYIVYSAVGSFYLPMAIIGYVYVRIYLTIRRIKLQGVSGVVNIDFVNGGSEIVPDPIGGSSSKPTFGSKVSSCKGRFRRKGAARIALSRSAPTRMTMRVHKGGYREDQTTPLLNRKQSERLIPPPQTLLNTPHRRSFSTSGYANPHFGAALGHKRQLSTTTLATTPSPCLSTPMLVFDSDSPSDGIARSGLESPRTTSTTTFMGFLAVPSHLTSLWYQRMDAFHRYHQKLTSELGALRTVGIVTGCFVACWIGFCIVYSIHAWPGCRPIEGGGSACIPDWVVTTMVWFGYANSAINPLIYASNEHFRRAFRSLLRCESNVRKHSMNFS